MPSVPNGAETSPVLRITSTAGTASGFFSSTRSGLYLGSYHKGPSSKKLILTDFSSLLHSYL